MWGISMRDIKRSRLVTRAIAASAAALILAGCSPAQDKISAESDASFWKSLGFISASEVNPATSLDDLTDRSSLIVSASIGAVREGPTFVTKTEGEADVLDYTTYLDLDLTDTIAGAAANEIVTVWVPGRTMGAETSTAESIWYLAETDDPGVYVLVADAGVIALDAGSLVTLREPNVSDEIIPPDVTSIDELMEATADLVG